MIDTTEIVNSEANDTVNKLVVAIRALRAQKKAGSVFVLLAHLQMLHHIQQLEALFKNLGKVIY